MQLGQTIQKIRKENNLTQEKFAELFHVTRQTVSNWENEKSYPDLLTLVVISDNFNISLDKMFKEDIKDALTFHSENTENKNLSTTEKEQLTEVLNYGFELYNAVYR